MKCSKAVGPPHIVAEMRKELAGEEGIELTRQLKEAAQLRCDPISLGEIHSKPLSLTHRSSH